MPNPHRRLDPRIVWTTCAALALAAACTMAIMPVVNTEWSNPAAWEPTDGELARTLFLFAGWFGGTFAGASALAFGAIRLAGLRPERRRRPERRTLITQVEVSTAGGSYQTSSENISRGGMFLTTEQSHAVGERLRLQFRLPELETPLSIQAEVRWIRSSGPAGGETPSGIGLLFMDPSAQVETAIRRFLAKEIGRVARNLAAR
jgi:uncharacterized protein (TIGR02266 family)